MDIDTENDCNTLHFNMLVCSTADHIANMICVVRECAMCTQILSEYDRYTDIIQKGSIFSEMLPFAHEILFVLCMCVCVCVCVCVFVCWCTCVCVCVCVYVCMHDTICAVHEYAEEIHRTQQ